MLSFFFFTCLHNQLFNIYLHINDFKATKSSPQGAYFPGQKPLYTVRGRGNNLFFVKLSQQIHNRIPMLSSEETCNTNDCYEFVKKCDNSTQDSLDITVAWC